MNRPPNEPSAGPLGPRSLSDAQSDREDVEALWRTHRRWLAAVLLAHMPNEAGLEDLLQEVALTVMKKLHQLEDPNRLRPWLRSIAINVARGTARAQQSGPKRVTPSPTEAFDPIDESFSRSQQRGSVRTELAHVLRLVRQLSTEHREPLLLKSVDGLSQCEIGEVLGISEEAVESRIARARRKLREAMYKRSESSTFVPPPAN